MCFGNAFLFKYVELMCHIMGRGEISAACCNFDLSPLEMCIYLFILERKEWRAEGGEFNAINDLRRWPF